MEGASFEASAGEINALLNAGGIEATLHGDASVRVSGVASIHSAGPSDLSFVRDEGYLRAWSSSASGVTLVTESLMQGEAGEAMRGATDRAVLAVPDADLALVALLSYVQGAIPSSHPPVGVHPTAVIDDDAAVDPSAHIGAYVTVGPGASIGPETVVRAHCSVGLGAAIGAQCILHERVTLGDRCSVGDRTTLHSGVVVGADGFGYRPPAPEAGLGPFPVKIPHVGIVRIGNDVEIGANTCIDRATHGVTSILDGCKIDNHVQIGHNCTIGPGAIICGQCGIAGSVTVGAGATLAGGACIGDNKTVHAGAIVAGMSGVACDVPAGETWWGIPARPIQRYLRKQAALEWLVGAMKPLRRALRDQEHEA